MRATLSSFLLVVSLGMTACGANGVLGLNPKPNGDITITNAVSGAQLETSLVAPFAVNGSGGFSIGITEPHFSGPYTVTVTSWTAPFSVPCFVPHDKSSGTGLNVVQFSADNAAPVAMPTQPSPCVIGDEETALISDNDGHSVNLYYRI